MKRLVDLLVADAVLAEPADYIRYTFIRTQSTEALEGEVGHSGS
jgi:hypothetical protein